MSFDPRTPNAGSTAGAESRGGTTLIDDLLAEQSKLTAVEEFSRAHDACEVRGRRYEKLLPATAPAPGQQYAFEVDLDKCTGCKACVTACHSLNGLDEDETWRSVGALVSTDPRKPLRQIVTTACHHCVDPGCLNGCPVLAYDKDPATGIVRHLDDQCIGCQYCVMMCPYEVPQFLPKRGIVRKCDMCHSRLAVGEAPACVQACPNEAIKIMIVDQGKVRGKYRQLSKFNFQPSSPDFDANDFLPDSPNPAITLPTTRYVSQRPLPAGLEAEDAHDARPSKAHPPLTLMLVLSQLGVGLAVMGAIAGGRSRTMAVASLCATLIAMIVGALHLGQPLKAWRSFLGWRKSWFSRELIVFGAFIMTLALHLAVLEFYSARPLTSPSPLNGERAGVRGESVAGRPNANATPLENSHPSPLIPLPVEGRGKQQTQSGASSNAAEMSNGFFNSLLSFLTALIGLAAVGCSAMIYVDTRRPFWNAPMTFGKFFGTTLLLGGAGALLLRTPVLPVIALAAIVLGMVLKLASENRVFRFLVDEQSPHLNALNKTALLLTGRFGRVSRVRVACVVAGGMVLPSVILLGGASGPALPVVALLLCVVGELIERHLFFVAEVAPKMPGGAA